MEVTLALGIAVFCLVVIFGLLSVGVNMSSVSIEQTTATNLLATVASDLRTAPNLYPKGQAVKSTIYQLPIPANVATGIPPVVARFAMDPPVYLDANGQVVAVNAARYRLSGWSKTGVGRDATTMHVMLTWPAAASLSKNAGSVEMLVALDRN